MDFFSTTLQDIHANGFPSNWSVPKVAPKEATWADSVLPGHCSENSYVGGGELSEAMPMRQQTVVL